MAEGSNLDHALTVLGQIAGGLLFLGKAYQSWQASRGRREANEERELPPPDPCADVNAINQVLREENERLRDELREKDVTIDAERERADRERERADATHHDWLTSRGYNHELRSCARLMLFRSREHGIDCTDIEERIKKTEVVW